MKKTLLAVSAALAATALPTLVHAEDASPLTFNVGVVSDYRYRGISQSGLKPAVQGGLDFAHSSGLYVGTWLSTIKWIKDGGTMAGVDAGKTPAEWDIYGGYKGEIVKGLGYDVGGLYYLYVGNKYGNIPGGANANTFEVYGALSYGPATLKYSHALTNTFGFGGSKNSGYLDASASFDVGAGITLAPHVGYQHIAGTPAASYTDYSLTVSKDFSGLVPSIAVVATDADKTGYVTPSGKFTGKTAVVLGLKYNF